MNKKELELLNLIKESTEVLNENFPGQSSWTGGGGTAPASKPRSRTGGVRGPTIDTKFQQAQQALKRKPQPTTQPKFGAMPSTPTPKPPAVGTGSATVKPTFSAKQPAAAPTKVTAAPKPPSSGTPLGPKAPSYKDRNDPLTAQIKDTSELKPTNFKGLGSTGSSFYKPTTVGPDTSRYNPKPVAPTTTAKPAVAPPTTTNVTGGKGPTAADTIGDPEPKKPVRNRAAERMAAARRRPGVPAAPGTGKPKPTLGQAVGKGAEAVGKGVGTVASLPFKAVGGFLKGVGSALGGKSDTSPNKPAETKQEPGGRVDTGKGVSYTVNPKGIFAGAVGKKAASNAAEGKPITAGQGGTTAKASDTKDKFVKPSPLDPGTPASPTQPKEELPPTNPEAETTIGVNPDSSPVSARPTTPTVSRMDQLKQFQADGVLSPRQEKELYNLTRLKELDDAESEETGVGVLSPRQKSERDRRDQIKDLQNMRTSQGGLTPEQQKELEALEMPNPVEFEAPANPASVFKPGPTQTPSDKPLANVYANTGEGESAADTTRTSDEDAELTRLRNQRQNAQKTGGPLRDPNYNQAQYVGDLKREIELTRDPKEKQKLQAQLAAFNNPLSEQQYISNARIAGIKRKLRLNHPLTLEEQAILRNNPYNKF